MTQELPMTAWLAELDVKLVPALSLPAIQLIEAHLALGASVPITSLAGLLANRAIRNSSDRTADLGTVGLSSGRARRSRHGEPAESAERQRARAMAELLKRGQPAGW